MPCTADDAFCDVLSPPACWDQPIFEDDCPLVRSNAVPDGTGDAGAGSFQRDVGSSSYVLCSETACVRASFGGASNDPSSSQKDKGSGGK